MATKPNISTVVSKQLPEFIREDYATFVTFLEAYYQWLDDNYAGRNLKELRDIDETLDTFVDYFKNELNSGLYFGFENTATLNERFILQRIKDYYISKGSETSLKFIIRALFNTEPEIFYPGSLILRASDGRWQQDISIFVDVGSGNIDDVVGKELLVYDSTGEIFKLRAFVDRYVYITDNLYEIFVQRYVGVVNIGDTVQYDGFAGTISGTTTSYEVLSGGTGFSIGQIFDIESAEGAGSKIKITKVDDNGAIEKLQIVKFGSGYTTSFVAQFSASTSTFDDPSPITISKNSTLVFDLPSNTYTGGFVEEGYVNVAGDYWTLDYCADGTYVGTALTSFRNEWAAGTDTTNLASIRFNISAEVKYPGYYSSNDGFISDSVFIQDSKYYQAFSYVIKIDRLLDSYKDVVKSFFHPAGMAMFAEYGIQNSFDMSIGIVVPENFIRLALSDSASPLDTVEKDFTFHPFSDSLTVPDSVAKTLNKVTTADSGEIPGEIITESDSGEIFLNSYTEGFYFSEDYIDSELAAATF